jgi:hypothetical protein
MWSNFESWRAAADLPPAGGSHRDFTRPQAKAYDQPLATPDLKAGPARANVSGSWKTGSACR